MKKVSTKKVSYFLAALGAASLMTITGCKKNESTVNVPTSKNEIATGKLSLDDFVNDLKKIKSLGFDPLSAKIIPGGYVVEGDIVLTKKNLDESFAALSTQQGQYSTKNPLSLVRTINVGFVDQSNTDKFSKAFDATLVDLNNLKVPLKFVKVTDTTKADIITIFKDLGLNEIGSAILGQDADFVDSKGNPGKHVYMTTNKAAEYTTASQAFISGVLDHEFGHAIGLRHTDYQNRTYGELVADGYTSNATDPRYQDAIATIYATNYVNGKYGKGSWDTLSAAEQLSWKNSVIGSGFVNEGDQTGTNGQAAHIYGTPLSSVYGTNTASDPASIMLSIAGNVNTTYSLYDNIAFFGIYGNPAQTALIRQSLTENGDLSATAKAAGTTLQQVVDAVKKLNSY